MQQEKNIENQNGTGSRKIFPVIYATILILGLGIVAAVTLSKKYGVPFVSTKKTEQENNRFEENFQESEIIDETAKMGESASPDWWVNSGGLMTIEEGVGKTVQGDLSSDSKWYEKYKKTNPEDTDEGFHPQNIFRLVNRGKWNNLNQEAYFKIGKINLSKSENRNESNGILLMSRYQDGDNLYYAGLRVDGSAVTKKKYDGKYYTLSEKKFFPGGEYDRDENPNHIPTGIWIGLRSELRNTPDGDLEIKLYVDEGKTGNWKLAASAVDDGRKEFGKHIISDEGHAGIRTDFMDVEFSGYKIAEF